MALKKMKPTTPGRRQMMVADFSDLSKKRPEKSLSHGKKRLSGRDGKGQVSIRHRGGGHKKLYRDIDFKQLDKERSSRSNTIRTAPRASPSSSTSTARSATSWLPRRSRQGIRSSPESARR